MFFRSNLFIVALLYHDQNLCYDQGMVLSAYEQCSFDRLNLLQHCCTMTKVFATTKGWFCPPMTNVLLITSVSLDYVEDHFVVNIEHGRYTYSHSALNS